MGASHRFQISIRLGLVLGIVALVLVTAALIHISWSLTARKNVTDLALRFNAQLIDNVSGKMSGLLDEAAATQQILVDSIEAGSLDIEDPKARNALLLSFMSEHPTLSSIQFGWFDDRSFAARRAPDGALKTTDEGSLGDEFWFKQAFSMSGASWSDVYQMRESGRLGFSVLSAVKGPQGPLGVLSVSMELERISAFLSGIKASANAAIFLTNTYREAVAVQTSAAPLTMMTALGATVSKLEDSSAPSLKIAAAAITASQVKLPTLRAPLQLTYRDPRSRATYFVTLAPLSQMGLIAGLVVPETDILGSIEQNTRRLGYALLGFVAMIAVIVALLATHTLARPLIAVTENTRRLGDFEFSEIRPVSSSLREIRTLSHAIGQMSASLASFKRYIPTEVVRALFAQGIEAELGGERRALSILFIDLMNFTRISETLDDDLIPFLGEFLSEMSDVVKAGGGTIDKYIGDGIMAFWGAPLPNEQHALFACRTALACQERLRSLRTTSHSIKPEALRARIGLNSGRVLVGNVGSRERLNYTVIGDPVNVASRLESLNKRYSSEILIGEDTYNAAKDRIVARRLDRVAVYGKAKGLEVYELLALAEEASPDLRAWVKTYEQATDIFRKRSWDEAQTLFMRVIEMRGGTDAPSRLMIERIEAFRTNPPPADWDGLFILSEK